MNTQNIRNILDNATFTSNGATQERERMTQILNLIDEGKLPPRRWMEDLEDLLVLDNTSLTCQFGNKLDKSTFRTNVIIRVIASKTFKTSGRKIYLITDGDVFGVAENNFMNAPGSDVLVCRKPLEVSKFKNEAELVERFGF